MNLNRTSNGLFLLLFLFHRLISKLLSPITYHCVFIFMKQIYAITSLRHFMAKILIVYKKERYAHITLLITGKKNAESQNKIGWKSKQKLERFSILFIASIHV